MKTRINLIVLAGCSIVLAACASDESINRETKIELTPMPKPANLIDEARWLDKGEPSLDKIVSIEDGLVARTVLEGKSKGCDYTTDGWFAPAARWLNCNGSTGNHKYTKTGNIWPLAVGKTESYKVEGKDNKNTWKTTRNCEVAAAVTVSIQDQQYQSYEVVCKDSFNTRTWYVSPQLQRTVKFKRRHHKRGLEVDSVAVLN
ncbi:hypothetical protein HBA54_17815 [Pelagibius litoralis]|uniref:Lipoprotein n=1 Tax=Pelagibius litoralis TaxID=374515 RepID=A0A967EZV8_9PROT|nr:hypothetical protein [Pelagibius litoralis]NIA70457.1 hypothetical protein [Pelagibius litoralis]